MLTKNVLDWKSISSTSKIITEYQQRKEIPSQFKPYTEFLDTMSSAPSLYHGCNTRKYSCKECSA